MFVCLLFQVPDDVGQNDNESEDEILNRESLTRRLIESENEWNELDHCHYQTLKSNNLKIHVQHIS